MVSSKEIPKTSSKQYLVSFFATGISNTTPTTIPLRKVLYAIRISSWHDHLVAANNAARNGVPFDTAKMQHLPAILVPGVFSGTRKASLDPTTYTGLVVVDIDGPMDSPSTIRDRLKLEQSIIAAWISPSLKGVKAICATDNQDPDLHDKAVKLVVDDLRRKGYPLDHNAQGQCAINRLALVSVDRDAWGPVPNKPLFPTSTRIERRLSNSSTALQPISRIPPRGTKALPSAYPPALDFNTRQQLSPAASRGMPSLDDLVWIALQDAYLPSIGINDARLWHLARRVHAIANWYPIDPASKQFAMIANSVLAKWLTFDSELRDSPDFYREKFLRQLQQVQHPHGSISLEQAWLDSSGSTDPWMSEALQVAKAKGFCFRRKARETVTRIADFLRRIAIGHDLCGLFYASSYSFLKLADLPQACCYRMLSALDACGVIRKLSSGHPGCRLANRYQWLGAAGLRPPYSTQAGFVRLPLDAVGSSGMRAVTDSSPHREAHSE